MKKPVIPPTDRNMSAGQVRTFVRLARIFVVVGAVFAAGLAATALTGGNALRTEPAASTEPAEQAAEQRLERSGAFLGYEILY
jgi:hypothetical protein